MLCEVQSTQRKDICSDANYTRVEKVRDIGFRKCLGLLGSGIVLGCRALEDFWVVGLLILDARSNIC